MKNKKSLCEPTSNLTLDLKQFVLFEMQSICPKHKKHLSSFSEITLKIKETLFSINNSQTALVPWSQFSQEKYEAIHVHPIRAGVKRNGKRNCIKGCWHKDV